VSAPLSPPRRLWRVFGALAIAHVALVFIGISFEATPFLGDSRRSLRADLVHSSMTRVLTGDYIEFLGYLTFLVAAVLLARLLRGSGPTAGWLSSLMQAAAVTFTSITLATGFAAGITALYDGHHGVPLDAIIPVSDLRILAFYVSVGVLGVFLLAAAGAVQATRLLPRWVTWSGYGVGVLCVVSGPIQPVWDAINYSSLLFFIWLLAVAALALRGPRAAMAATRKPVPAAV
jgi:hypothetical protein